MKKILTAAFAVAMTIMCVSAQPPEPPQGGGQRGPGGPMNPKMMVERLDKELTLTTEQKTKLTEIYTKQSEEMKKMFEASEEGERPDHETMKAMFEKNEAAVKAVLTDEQKAKYEEMRKKRPGPGGPRPEGGPEGERPE